MGCPPEALRDFFRRPEWETAKRWLKEAREDALASLWTTDPKDIALVARLQQEVSVLSYIIGDHHASQSFEDDLVNEALEFAVEEQPADEEADYALR